MAYELDDFHNQYRAGFASLQIQQLLNRLSSTLKRRRSSFASFPDRYSLFECFTNEALVRDTTLFRSFLDGFQ